MDFSYWPLGPLHIWLDVFGSSPDWIWL